MKEFLTSSVYFGVAVSLLTYGVGLLLHKKLKWAVVNPLLISVVSIILLLTAAGVEYETYAQGAKYLEYLLTPATVSLAIPLYEKISLLKRDYKAILGGILSGVLTSLCSILALSALFGLDHASYVTLLPKSITTAIAMGICEEMGGYVTVTVAIIAITGILGNAFAQTACRLLRITEPVAVGVAIGTSSHAMGTARAVQLGEVQGAISGLSIAVAGLLTVVLAPLFEFLL